MTAGHQRRLGIPKALKTHDTNSSNNEYVDLASVSAWVIMVMNVWQSD